MPQTHCQTRESNFSSWPFLSIVLLLATFASCSASTNRNNYNPYNYDQTTPAFTPDGRLLQVEYASAAAELSPPLVVLECTIASSYDDETMDASSSCYPCLILLTIPKQVHTPQQRIVILENNNCKCLAMSGILADSLALLQAGLKESSAFQKKYQRSMGILALARTLADECQSRVFGGGIRPYGSTLLLCGYEMDGNENKDGRRYKSLIFQTDPSGGLLQHGREEDDPDATSNKKSRRTDGTTQKVQCHVRCIVGGSPGLQRQLHKRISQGMAKLEQQQQRKRTKLVSLQDRIATLAKILIKETESASSSHNNNNKKQEDIPLEIVVVSPGLGGCHRFDEGQIQAIQKQLTKQDA